MTQFSMLQAKENDICLRPLRPRQEAVIEAIRQAIREGHKRIMVQAPTGFGKTLVAAHIIAACLGKKNRPMFSCPAIALVNQTVRAFQKEGIYDIGVIQAQHEMTDWQAPVQVASVQTLIRRPLPKVDLVIVDEAHEVFKGMDARMDSEEWKGKIIIGMSATPYTRGLGLRWTKLVIAATIQELIDEGFLSPFRVFAPDDAHEADLSTVKSVADKYGDADFQESGLQKVMDTPELVADAVETYVENGEGRQGFLYAVNRAHAQSLRDEFLAAGVTCGYIDGNSTPEERTETFARYRSGKDVLISSVGCLVTGIDEDVRIIIDCAPTKSEIVWVQRFGRGLRTSNTSSDFQCPDDIVFTAKVDLRYHDHAGNSIRLGFPTDIHHEELDMRKPGEKAKPEAKPPKKPCKCRKCGMVTKTAKCENCGEQMKLVSDVIVRDGELVERGAKAKKVKALPADKQAFYSGLLHIAHSRGYSDGWAAHAYREKFGVWPVEVERVASPPTLEVSNFDKWRRIRNAKSKQKAVA